MSAFMLGMLQVTDSDRFPDYAKAEWQSAKKYGGIFRVRGGVPTLLDGWMPADRIVIIEFTNEAAAKKWYNSPEYQQAKKLRDASAVGTFVAVDSI